VNQKWRWSQDDVLYVLGGYSSNALDAKDGSSSNGTAVWNFFYNATSAQQWRFVGVSIVGEGGLCLEGKQDGAPNGSGTQLRPCEGSDDQKWTLNGLQKDDAFDSRFFQIRGATVIGSETTYCLEENPTQHTLMFQPCSQTTAAQAFRFNAGGRIRAYSGECVVVDQAIPVPGAQVRTKQCWDDYNPSRFAQQWYLHGEIYNALGTCLDVELDSEPRDGSKVQLWACNGASSQRWVFWP
jgi:hypothetical protein